MYVVNDYDVFKSAMNCLIFFTVILINFDWSLELSLPNINRTLGERRDFFHHEQAVAIVDVNNKNETIRCEVIEVE